MEKAIEKRCAKCGRVLTEGEYVEGTFDPLEGDIYGMLENLDFEDYAKYMMMSEIMTIYRCKDQDSCEKEYRKQKSEDETYQAVRTAFKDLYKRMNFTTSYYITPICNWVNFQEIESLPSELDGAKVYLLDNWQGHITKVYVTSTNLYEVEDERFIRESDKYLPKEMEMLARGAEDILKNCCGEKTLNQAYIHCEI